MVSYMTSWDETVLKITLQINIYSHDKFTEINFFRLFDFTVNH